MHSLNGHILTSELSVWGFLQKILFFIVIIFHQDHGEPCYFSNVSRQGPQCFADTADLLPDGDWIPETLCRSLCAPWAWTNKSSILHWEKWNMIGPSLWGFSYCPHRLATHIAALKDLITCKTVQGTCFFWCKAVLCWHKTRCLKARCKKISMFWWIISNSPIE